MPLEEYQVHPVLTMNEGEYEDDDDEDIDENDIDKQNKTGQYSNTCSLLFDPSALFPLVTSDLNDVHNSELSSVL